MSRHGSTDHPLAGDRGRLSTLGRDLREGGSPVSVVQAGGVAIITLDRPDHHNALDRSMSEPLLEAFVRAAADPTVRVVVLTGSGRAFCTGDDVGSVDRWRGGDGVAAPLDPLTHDAHYLRVCEEMLHLPKPVIVAVNGPSAGAGTELMCAADYRLSASSATIGSRLLAVGHVGNVVLMSRVVGPARATEIYLSRRMVSADEALRIGLVDAVVPDEELVSATMALASEWADLPTRAVGLFKDLRERALGQPVEYGLRMQDMYHLRTHDEVQDAAEGVTAFAERRVPRFDGD